MIKYEKIPQDILQKLPGIKKLLFQDSNVVFAYLFGGLASGVCEALSDIDIAVYLRDIKDFSEYKLNLFDKLTAVLGTTELDLVILNTAPVSLTGRILQKKVLLVDKEPFIRHLFESLTLRKFFDFKNKEDTFFSLRYNVG